MHFVTILFLVIEFPKQLFVVTVSDNLISSLISKTIF